MSEAQDKVKELRRRLEKAKKTSRAEAAKEREDRRALQRQKDAEMTDEFRKDNFDATVGEYSDYLGLTFGGDRVSITFAEWTVLGGTVTLKDEQAQQLIEALQASLK